MHFPEIWLFVEAGDGENMDSIHLPQLQEEDTLHQPGAQIDSGQQRYGGKG